MHFKVNLSDAEIQRVSAKINRAILALNLMNYPVEFTPMEIIKMIRNNELMADLNQVTVFDVVSLTLYLKTKVKYPMYKELNGLNVLALVAY